MEGKILKQILTKVEGLDEKIDKMEVGIRKDMKAMETGIREDMRSIETGIREDMRSMETGIRDDIKNDMTIMRKEITNEIKDRIIEERIHTEQFVTKLVKKEISDVKEYVDNLHKSYIQELGNIVDTIGETIDSNYQNHEKRIVRLEKIIKVSDLRKNTKSNNVISIVKKDNEE